MSYQKILVALDRSNKNNIIFQQALEIAKHNQAQLMIFHCLALEETGIGNYTNLYGEELVNWNQSMEETLKQEIENINIWLSGYAEQSQAEGIPTQMDWKLGDAGRWIREMAHTWQADLIVLGRRGRQGLAEFFLGSVSNYIVHHATCSVLVVQGKELSE